MKKKKEFISYEEKYLVSELLETRNALAVAYSNFENVTDPDLIDSCIYQVNSVQKRYKFLLERAKEANIAVLCEIAENEF
ncbi:MAG: YaaL family protein [Butyrivibrio sp.]